jgi:ParB family chromosome partitioning protein
MSARPIRLAAQPETALVALLHTLIGRIFFEEYVEGCVSIIPRTAELSRLSQTVGQSKAAAALLARNARWRAQLPDREGLWLWIAQLGNDDRMNLLAYCTAVTVDVVFRRQADWNRRAEANLLATALRLDMAEWWRPTQAGFLDRITKEQILQAVSEGRSAAAARRLANHKKGEMARQAEALLVATRWLPEPLRPPSTDDVARGESPPVSVSA